MGELLSGFWHGVGHPSSMDGWMEGWVGAWVTGRGLRGPGCWPWVQGKQGQVGLWGCPSPWHLGMQTGGWLRSPELAPSEHCSQPPTCTPRGGQALASQATAQAGCQRAPSPRWACHLPKAMRPVPKHDLGVTRVPSVGTESQLFPRQAQEQRAGYGQPRWQDHTCPQGPGCPRDATAPGWHLARDRGMAGEEGGWLGHRHCHRSDYPARLQPPVDTVHQGSRCCLGGPEKCPGPWPPRRAVPRAPGSARCRRLWVCRDELHLTASSW